MSHDAGDCECHWGWSTAVYKVWNKFLTACLVGLSHYLEGQVRINPTSCRPKQWTILCMYYLHESSTSAVSWWKANRGITVLYTTLQCRKDTRARVEDTSHPLQSLKSCPSGQHFISPWLEAMFTKGHLFCTKCNCCIKGTVKNPFSLLTSLASKWTAACCSRPWVETITVLRLISNHNQMLVINRQWAEH